MFGPEIDYSLKFLIIQDSNYYYIWKLYLMFDALRQFGAWNIQEKLLTSIDINNGNEISFV